jgi:peptidoglycan/LPS O-acetylase OafA/YrhL
MSRDQNSKDVPLEALRGIASLSVMASHLGLAFFPRHFPINPPGANVTIFNGAAAVNFFFVLSGFVLTRRALASGGPPDMMRAALKRWPRLAAPITLAVLLSWFLFATHLYRYAHAGAVTQSDWLAHFANVGTPQDPGLVDALQKGLFTTLFRGDYSYDSNLWTMAVEFRGSFLALALAVALMAFRSAPRRATVVFSATIALMVWCAAPLYLTFVAGVLLAAALARRPLIIPQRAAWALLLAGALLETYANGSEYGPGGIVLGILSPINIHIAAALLLLVAVEGAPAVRHQLSGPWAILAGRFSFPIYLVHILLICSAGSAVLLALNGLAPAPWPKVAAAVTSILATIAVAYPLAVFDRRWVRQMSVAANRLTQ